MLNLSSIKKAYLNPASLALILVLSNGDRTQIIYSHKDYHTIHKHIVNNFNPGSSAYDGSTIYLPKPSFSMSNILDLFKAYELSCTAFSNVRKGDLILFNPGEGLTIEVANGFRVILNELGEVKINLEILAIGTFDPDYIQELASNIARLNEITHTIGRLNLEELGIDDFHVYWGADNCPF